MRAPEAGGAAAPPTVGEVVVLRWPAQDHLRPIHSGTTARAAVLVVPRGGPLPRDLAAHEDWLYDDASPQEVAARVASVAGRIDRRVEDPRIDEGLLRNDGRWVALSQGQLPVVELLVERLDGLVSLGEVVAAMESGGARATPASRRALLHRIGRRVETVGLRLTSVRGRGVVLSRDPGRVEVSA